MYTRNMYDKEYLGDAVYICKVTGNDMLVIYTPDDKGNTSNEVFLEHEVIRNLFNYLKLHNLIRL